MVLFNTNNNKLQNKKKQKFSPDKQFLADILFPKTCVVCGREKSFLCEDCFSLIEGNPFQYCLCSKPQRVIDKGKCRSCRDQKLSGLYSSALFDQKALKACLHNFKYNNYLKDLAYPLSYLIILHLEYLKKKLPADAILMPVPLCAKKERERGYNQSNELAKILSRAWGTELCSENLIKIKNTPAQATLGKAQRKENLKNCFAVKRKEEIEGKRIYLIDDVYTTGATMEECAKTLKEAGASQVWGITVARELKF
ncbi:MAG: phosphoribosyltransferase family protein [Candidatus Paceibacterota bacterium]|jgi:ComF family protein